MKTITYEEFSQVELRSGTITQVEPYPEAKKPAYKVWADFGPEIGILKTSARVTEHYTPEQLVGKTIVGCINLGTKQIGKFVSEFLLVGFSDKNSAVRLVFVEGEVPAGSKLH